MKKKVYHGYSKHPLYNIYRGIKSRCYTPSQTSYSAYGERGVKMCEEWLANPALFIEWAIKNGWGMGMQIDKDIIPFKRGEIGLLYSPENCSVVHRKINSLYKVTSNLLTINGVTKNMRTWCDEVGISWCALKNRIQKKGMSPEEAILWPVGTIRKYKVDKQMADEIRELKKGGVAAAELSKMYHISASSIWCIINGKRWL